MPRQGATRQVNVHTHSSALATAFCGFKMESGTPVVFQSLFASCILCSVAPATLPLSPLPPPPSSPSLHPASVVGDPLFDPLFSRGSEGVHDRKADGGEPLITIETEEGLPESSPSSMLHCVLACSCLPALYGGWSHCAPCPLQMIGHGTTSSGPM